MAARAPITEAGFHRWLRQNFRGSGRGRLPIGDDTAAIPIGGGRVALLTTDALVEWTHFLPHSPPGAIGSAAAAASLSDVAAKGGRPIALTLDLLMPAETDPRWARDVVRGADRTMRRFGGALVGGDTKSAEGRAVIGTVLALGTASRLAPHSGLRPGDELWTTGVVGAGGRAYQRFTAGDPTDRGHLRKLLAIEPRVREGSALVRYAHAMVDTSDGLAEGARRLAEASGVRIEIEAEGLRLAPGLSLDEDGGVPGIAFFGGDYELLSGIPPGRSAEAERVVRTAGGRLHRIGRALPGRGVYLREPSGLRSMPEAGWSAFGRGLAKARTALPPRASA